MICDTAGLHGGGNILENNITRKVIRGLLIYQIVYLSQQGCVG